MRVRSLFRFPSFVRGEAVSNLGRLAVVLGILMPAPVYAQTAVATGDWVPSSSAGPSGRSAASAAYDAKTGNVVLFGGANGTVPSNDIWVWDGTAWTQQAPAANPSARFGAHMVYDSATGTVVLFGGKDGSGNLLGDTWSWDGTTWTQVATTGPSARFGFALAYDAATGTVLLFGGRDSTGVLGDTWSWNGSAWVQLSPSTSPAARLQTAMEFDGANGTVVLFGGSDGTNALSDTWVWNGTTWSQLSPAAVPAARSQSGMVFDAATGLMDLVGGQGSSGLLQDTWSWNGTNWTLQNTATSPSSRSAAAMVYDLAQGTVMLFGGTDGTNQLSDTWNYYASPFNAVTTAVGTSSAQIPVYFSITASGTSGTPLVMTNGAANLDYTLGTGNTCIGPVTAGTTCQVNVVFKPQAPGQRLGAVQLVNNSGATVATALLFATGTAPLATFPSNTTPTTLGSGFTKPYVGTVDAAGNIYVANSTANTVQKIVAVNGSVPTSNPTITTLGSGFSSPTSVAVDGAGNVYVADVGHGAVKEIVAVGGTIPASPTIRTLGSGFSQPNGIAVDGAGNVYVTDGANEKVYEIVAVGGSIPATSPTIRMLANDFSFVRPYAIAVDNAGDVFVADFSQTDVFELMAAGGSVPTSGATVRTIAVGDPPTGIAVDSAGDVYVSISFSNSLKEFVAVNGVVPASPTVLTFTSSLNSPNGVALDSAGNIYVGDTSNNAVREFTLGSAPSLAFGTVNVGSTSAAQTVTLQNTGNSILTFPLPASGTNPSISANFGVVASSTCPQLTSTSSAAGTLASGSTCSEVVNFTPTTGGASSGSLVIQDNSNDVSSGGQSIALGGTGNVLPTPSVTITSVVIAQGTASTTLTASVSYTGSTKPSGAFTFRVDSGTTSSGTCTGSSSPLTCTSTYTTSGLVAGSHTITGSVAADANFNAGSGTGTLTVNSGSSTAQTTNVGSTSGVQTATVTITTAGTLGTISVLTSGASSQDYLVASGGSCATGTAYAVNATCTVNYTFSPKYPGLRLGAVQLINTAGTGAMAVTPLSGVGIAPLVAFPSNTTTTAFGSGFSSPSSVAVDALGDVYVADTSSNAIKEMIAVGGAIPASPTIKTLGSGFSSPKGIAVDGAGDVYVADTSNKLVKEIVAVNGVIAASPTIRTLGSGFKPNGVAVDGAGNVYVADTGNSAVKEIIAVGGVIPSTSPTIVTLGSGFSAPAAVAVDASGNVYVADTANHAVKEMVAVGGSIPSSPTILTLTTTITSPTSIAVDAAGDVYVGTDSNSGVKELVAVNGSVPTSNPTILTLGSGLTTPYGVALDSTGNAYVTDQSGSQVKEIATATAPSLSFASTLVGSSSASQNVTLQNIGNLSLALPVPGTGINPSLAANFTVGGSSTCPQIASGGSPGSVATGATCTEVISLTPTTTGNLTGSLVVTDNSNNGSNVAQSVSLSGTGYAIVATVTVNPASVLIGATSTSLSASVAYTGSNAPTGAFTFQVDSGSSVAAACMGSNSPLTCTATYSLPVLAAGSHTITGNLASDANFSSASGTGTLTVAPGQYTVPSTNVATTSATQTAVVYIATAGTLGTIDVLTGGATGGDYALVSGGSCATSTSYAVSTSCTVNYTFKPKYAGQRMGAIQLLASGGTTVMGSALLSGTAVGPQIAFPSASPTLHTLGSGFASPAGVAVDGAGDVFVADRDNNAVKEVIAVGGSIPGSPTIRTLGSGFNSPWSIAVDGAGDVFVMDQGSGSVKELLAVGGGVPASNPTIRTLATGIGTMSSIALDGAGNVYIADEANHAVKEIVAVGGSISATPTIRTLGSGFTYPASIAVDGFGNVFVGDLNNNGSVSEIMAVGGSVPSSNPTIVVLSSAINEPYGLTVDAAGDVYASEPFAGVVQELLAVGGTIPPGTATVVTVGSGFNGNVGIALDGAGDLFVADLNAGATREVTPTLPGILIFQNTLIGNVSADSPKTFNLQNIGNAALTLPVPGSGANPEVSSPFSFDASTTCPQVLTGSGAPAMIAAGSVCTEAIDFTPSGAFTSDLPYSLTSNTGYVVGTQTSTLQGTGMKGAVSISVNAVSMNAATASVVLSASVTYPGTATPTGAFTFQVDSGTPVTATCNGSASPLSCTASYNTSGLSFGGHTITASKAADSFFSAAAGTNTLEVFPVPSVAPTTAVGTTSAVQTVTVLVTTAGKVGSLAVLTNGAAGKDYALVSGGSCAVGSTYAANATCTVAYTFTPKMPGERYGAVQLVDSTGAIVLGTSLTSGTGVGPLVAYPSHTTSVSLAGGFNNPTGVALDGAGDVYVIDSQNNALKEIVAVNGSIPANPTIRMLGSGFISPYGVAVDGAGNVYVADTNNSAVKELLAVGGSIPASPTILTLGSGFTQPHGIAVDGLGNVYVADPSNKSVYELVAVGGSVPPSNAQVLTIASGYDNPFGVAVDASGNVFFADADDRSVYEIPSGGGSIRTLATDVGTNLGIAVDAAGDVYLADAGGTAVSEIVAVGGSIPANPMTLRLSAGSVNPSSLVIDGEGNIYVGDTTAQTLNLLSVAAPPSLTFRTSAIGTASPDSPQQVTLQNIGNAALTFAVPATGLNPSIALPFSLDASSSCPVVAASGSAAGLGAGGLCSDTIDFTPSSQGAFNGALEVEDNNNNVANAIQTVILAGIAETPQGPYAAPTTSVGTTSQVQTVSVLITNAGTLGSISVMTQGAAGKDYALISGGSCTTGTSYVVAAQCTVSYTFTPLYPGQRLGAVQLIDNTGSTVLGTALLSGTGVGPLVAFPGNAAATQLGSGFQQPAGIALDGFGNLYVADNQNNVVTEVMAVGGSIPASPTMRTLGGNFNNPAGVAVDGAGNVYVADNNDTNVYELLAVAGAVPSSFPATLTLGGTFANPAGIAVDGAGNVYVADSGKNAIYEIAAVGGTVSQSTTPVVLGNGFSHPAGIAVDGAGDIYVADTGNHAVKELLAVNGQVPLNPTVRSLGSGWVSPMGVTVDAAGDLYVTDQSNGVVYEVLAVNGAIPATNPTIMALSAGVGITPFGIAVDGAGDVFASITSNNSVEEIALSAAPALNFASTTVGNTSTDSPRTVAVENVGNTALSFVIPGTGANPFTSADFALDASGTCPVVLAGASSNGTLATGAVCVDEINFVPMTTGSLTGNLVQTDNSKNATNATQSIGLSGIGYTAAAGGPYIAPTTNVGATSATQSVTIVIQTAGQVGAIDVLTKGAIGQDYAFVSGGSCTAGTSYTANATCTVAYSFTPKFPGQRYGAIELLDSTGSVVMGTVLLSGTGTGPLISFPSNINKRVVGRGFSQPNGLALDGAGDLFVADPNASTVTEVLAVNGSIPANASMRIFSAGLVSPIGVAVDGAGNVYIADAYNAQVYELLAVGGTLPSTPTMRTLPGSYSDPSAVAVDASGDVFVADSGVVHELEAVGGSIPASPTILSIGSSEFGDPTGLASDASGNLFVTDAGDNALFEVMAVGGGIPANPTIVRLSNGNSQGVAVDAAGDVYAVNGGTAAMELLASNGSIPASNPGTLTLGSGFVEASAIALDSSGNAYVSDHISNVVYELALSAAPDLTFASTAVGNTSADSPQALISQNIGNRSLLFAIPASGVNPAVSTNFAIAATSTCPQVASTAMAQGLLAEGAVCTDEINFIPTTTGPLSGTLVLTDNSNQVMSAMQAVVLNGTGGSSGGATASFTVAAVTIDPGTASVALNATLSYTGSSAPSGAVTLQVDTGTVVAANCSGSTSPLSCYANYNTASLASGTHTITASLAAGGGYNAASGAGTLMVKQSPAPIVWNPSSSRLFVPSAIGNGVLDASDATPGSIVYVAQTSGSGTFTVTKSTVLAAGDYTITALFTPTDTTTYASTYANVTLTVLTNTVFVGNGGGTVASFFNGGTVQSSPTSGGGIALAVDNSGSVWSIDAGAASISRFSDTGSLAASFSGIGLNGATALAIDGDGKVWIANGNRGLIALSNNGTLASTAADSSISSPNGVAIDVSGNVWLSNSSTNTVVEIIGGAAPAAPLATSVQTATPGTRP